MHRVIRIPNLAALPIYLLLVKSYVGGFYAPRIKIGRVIVSHRKPNCYRVKICCDKDEMDATGPWPMANLHR